MPDARSMTEMGLNTAMMFAFAIPGGEVVGAALAVVELLVSLLWQDQPIPPEEQPVSVAAFNAALDDLRTEIRNILTDAKRLENTCQILALTRILHANWAAALSVKTTSDRLNNFEAYDFVQDDCTAAFVERMSHYFNEDFTSTTVASVLSAVKIDPTAKDAIAQQNNNFGLFMLTGSLIAGYLKAAIAWEWANEILGVRKWNAYQIAEKAWKKNPDPNHPELEPIKPDKSVQTIPAWQDWITEAGSHVQPLIGQIDELLAYAEDTPASDTQPATKGVYTAMRKNWDDRDSKTFERTTKFSLIGAKGHSVTDAQTGYTTGPFETKTQAEWVMDAMIGSQIAYEWESRTRKGRLDLVNPTDLELYGKSIQQWKKIRDSVQFHTFPWPAAGQPDKEIPSHYNADDRGDRIFSANRAQIPLSRKLTPGMQLTIPSLDGVAAPASYTVKAGDTLRSIAPVCYPDAALVGWIFDVNKNKLTGQPPVFQEGAVLKYPDLSSK